MHPINPAEVPGGPCTRLTLTPKALGAQRQIRQTLGDGPAFVLCNMQSRFGPLWLR